MMKIKRNRATAFWCDEIDTHEREFKKWASRSKKIIKRYKDERSGEQTSAARFNILWSNVQTLAPALYAKNPVPNVDRRFEDDDVLGTTAARVLERATAYFIDDDLFGNVMTQVVLDRLLPGRGTAWTRYVPNFVDTGVSGGDEVQKEGPQITEDIQIGDEATEQEVYSEDVEIDYVHWEDFGHTWGRTWEEVRAVWRRVYMDRTELKARFGDIGKEVPLEKKEKSGSEKGTSKKACVYEIWDKVKKEVIWINKSMEKPLDKRADPLNIKGFFPCPKPVYATLANDNLIPSPDYVQYQDQANELDELTGRIGSITKTLKVVGVYDKSAEGLSRLLSEGLQNTMVPVEQWALHGEKGGLKGAVDWFPMEMVVSTLISLYEAREKVKQDLYEITGISDIIRGATNANETATAQQIKGQFATLRLDNMQKDVARFARDLVRMTAEIVAEHFSIETIKQICGIRLLHDTEKQALIQQQPAPVANSAQQQPNQANAGEPQPPPTPELPDEIKELLELPTWEEVEKLLRDDTLRCFRISIETDSTIKADQENEKQSRVELIGAVGQYLQQTAAMPIELQPLAAEMLMFGVKGFKVSRELETTFEVALKDIKKAAEEPAPPNPEQLKAEADQQKDQAKMQMDQQKDQAKLQIEGQKAQAAQQKDQASMQMEMQKMQIETQAKQAEYEFKLQELELKKAEMAQQMQLKQQELQIKQQEMEIKLKSGGFDVVDGGKIISPEYIELINTVKALAAPRSTEVVRDEDGKLIGAVSTVQ
jgi:hypothetical protein